MKHFQKTRMQNDLDNVSIALNDKLGAISSDLKMSSETNIELEHTNNSMKSQLGEILQSMMLLKSEKLDFEMILQSQHELLEKIEVELAENKNAIKYLQNSNDKLKEQLFNLNVSTENLQLENESAINDIVQLKEEKERLENTVIEYSNEKIQLTETIKQKEDAIKTIENSYNQLQEYHAIEKETSEEKFKVYMQSKNDEKGKISNDFNVKISKLEDEVISCNQHKEELNQKNIDLNKNIESLKNEILLGEENLENLNREKIELAESSQNLNVRIIELSMTIDDMGKEKDLIVAMNLEIMETFNTENEKLKKGKEEMCASSEVAVRKLITF